MAKTKVHLLEYVEQGLLDPTKHRAQCSCGVTHEGESVSEVELWHIRHVERHRAQTA